MKKFKVIALAISCIMVSCHTPTEKHVGTPISVVDVDLSANPILFHDAVLQIVASYAARVRTYQDADNVLLCKEDRNSINFVLDAERKEWIKIFYPSDSLFELHTENKNFILGKHSDPKAIVTILPALSEVLIPIIGCDSVMKMISPFFDKESSQLYLAELEKAQKKMADIMFVSRPDIQDHKVDSRGFKDGFYFDYSGPGKWNLYKGSLVSFRGPFVITNLYTSCASISYSINSDDPYNYDCGLYGCQKSIQTTNGWVYTPISVDEFKKNYSSPF